MLSKVKSDLHTHTTYSHGLGSIMDNVRVAYEAGLETVGISDHGPGHITYGIDLDKYDQMREDIDKAMMQFPTMEILLGVEANIVNFSGRIDLTKEEQAMFDYVIAGYHYAYLGENIFHGIGTCVSGWLDEHGIWEEREGRINMNTEIVISALEENNIKILSHPGDKLPVKMEAIARVCERRGTLMEINNHHTHMTTEEIRIAKEFNVNFILSSDAHKTENVGRVEGALERAIDAELDLSRIVNLRA